MENRKLTGKWYLKSTFFGYKVMVETIKTTTCEFDFSTSPEIIIWEKAKEGDLFKLNITNN